MKKKKCEHKRFRINATDDVGFCRCVDCKELFPLYEGLNLMIERFEQILAKLEVKVKGGKSDAGVGG